MNREQILISLRELRDQLPVDLINSNYGNTVAAELADQLLTEQIKLKNNTASGIINEPDTEEIKTLQRELESADYNYGYKKREIVSAENEQRFAEADLDLHKYRLERARKQLSLAESEEDKKGNQRIVDQVTQEISEIEEEIKKHLKDIAELNAELVSDEGKYKAAEAKLKAARQGKLDTIEGDYRNKINESKNNVEFLKTKAGYLSLNVAKTLDDLITDYEDGVADEREVNYRVNQIREALGSNTLIDKFEQEEANIVNDQVEAYDDRIEALEEKISDDQNYIMSEDEYQIKFADLKSTKRKMQNNFSAQNRRYQDNIQRMEAIRKEVEENKNLDNISIQELIAESKRIEERNLGIQSRMDARREEISSLNKDIKSLVASHNIPDLSAKSKDEEELNSLNIARERMLYLDRLHNISLNDKMNTLLLGTGSKLEDLKSKNALSKFGKEIKPLTDDELHIDEFLPPIIKDEDKDLGKDPAKKDFPPLTPPIIKDEDKNLGTEPKKKDFPPLTPPVIGDKDKDLGTEPKAGKAQFPQIEGAAEPPRTPVEGDISAFTPPKSKLREKLKKLWIKVLAVLAMLGIGFAAGALAENQYDFIPNPTAITQQSDHEDTISTLRRLQDLIIKCLTVDGSKYTEDSYNAMMEKVYHIQELLKGDITEDTCKQELDELQKLYDDLELKKVADLGGDTGSHDGGVDTPDTPDTPDNPDTPDDPDEPDEPTDPVVDTDEEHENNPDIIYLAPGDSAGIEGGGTVDYDGVQRDENGNVIGEADTTTTPGNYTVVPVDEIPGPSADTPNDVPTGHETTDTSDLSDEAQAELDRQVQEDIDNGLITGFDDLSWEGFVGGATPSITSTTPVL